MVTILTNPFLSVACHTSGLLQENSKMRNKYKTSEARNYIIILHTVVLWDVTLYGREDGHQRFGATFYLHLHDGSV
jgi:hypothetical protein